MQDEKEDVARVAPSVPCVTVAGSTAERLSDAVTAAVRPEYSSGCTEPEFTAWWEGFGRALDDDNRVNREMLALAAFCAGKGKRSDRVGRAMWALSDHLRALGHPFQSWPDDVKLAFGWAMIADDQTPTAADIARTHELAARFGWELAEPPSIHAVDPVPGVVAALRRAPEDPSSLPSHLTDSTALLAHPARHEEP